MKGNLLIVGGSGFIGRNLAVKSTRLGYISTVISLTKIDVEKKIPGVNYIQVDITNLVQLRKKLLNKIFHYVINLSGYINHSSFLDGGRNTINTHFGGVQNLLQVLDWSTLKRFIQIGSSDEYGRLSAPQHEDMSECPISSYSLGKVASTKLLLMLHRTENLPVVILRLFLVYGKGQNNKRFLPQVIRGCLLDENFPTSKGEQLRDFCHVDDISTGILSSLVCDKVDGEIINLASGDAISIREIIEIIQSFTGSGKPEFGKIAYRNGENMALYADITKAKRLLNWNPSVDIYEGLEKTVNYYKNENIK